MKMEVMSFPNPHFRVDSHCEFGCYNQYLRLISFPFLSHPNEFPCCLTPRAHITKEVLERILADSWL